MGEEVCCQTCAKGIHEVCKDFDDLIAEFSEEDGVTCEMLVGLHGCNFGDEKITMKDLCCETCTKVASGSLETKIAATGKELQLYSDETKVGFFGWAISKAASWWGGSS